MGDGVWFLGFVGYLKCFLKRGKVYWDGWFVFFGEYYWVFLYLFFFKNIYVVCFD